MPREPLPVDAALPRLAAALREHGNAVLRAPPGAGKTTRVPPALLDSGLAGDGQVVVLEPRRLAARAAARRIAAERDGAVGGEVGYAVRFDRRVGPRTRIVVVTEGVFLRRLQEDPFLEGVGAVVFDEFHERNLASDLALAMVRRVQRETRNDLLAVAMSATLDPGPLAGFLGGAGVVECDGFLHPVEVRWDERPDARRIEERAADGVRRALAAAPGDVLVFLPGVAEIRRTVSLLAADAARLGVDLVELFGDLPPERQDAALARGPRRRVVLATNVAESSVTVEGVSAVVDTGLARVLRHDPAVGMGRLAVERISLASAVQRSGRAGRQGPGLAFRLWTRNEERSLADETEPEVRRIDLAGAALELLAWGETDLAAFPWFEAPEPARLAAALDLLARLGATDGRSVTDLGRTMARLPVHPRAARLLVEGHRLGRPRRAALAAALLTERDPVLAATRPRGAVHHSESDLLDRIDLLEAFERNGVRRGPMGDLHEGGARSILAVRDQLERLAGAELGAALAASADADETVLRAVLAGFPDRLARRREPGSPRAVLVTGRGVRLATESSVADPELFVALDVDARDAAEALVRSASGVRREWLPAERVRAATEVAFDEASERVVAFRRTRFDELVLDEAAAVPDDDCTAALLAEAASSRLDRALALDAPDVASFLARVRWLCAALPECGLPAMDDAFLRGLLPDLCAGRRSFDDLRRAPLLGFLRGALSHAQSATLDREAPERIEVPSGSRIALRYEEGRAPVLAVRIQEAFGWADTPRLAGGRVKVVLHLLAPNGRPQQVTDDLRSFWANTYPEVRRELRRRYPRHSWPEDPWTARAERRPARRPPPRG